MKRLKSVVALLCCFFMLTGFTPVVNPLLSDKETITFDYQASENLRLIITEEIIDDQIIIREYHNQKIIEESTYKLKEYHGLEAPFLQPETAKITPMSNPNLSGTKYTVNESNHYLNGEVFYNGYSSAGWRDHSMGINIGHYFFPAYFQIASWK